MTRPSIPFNRPFVVGKELHYISQAVVEGRLAGDGRFTRQCQSWLESQFGVKKALLTHSCTAALEMAAILADISPGDEVIAPSYTFVSTANAFVLRGAHVRFVDIRADTLNIDESQIEAAINPRTRAIVPVHYAGVGCEMQTINAISQRHDLVVIEDAAQAVGATYHGHYLGSLGHMGAISFHETKNFISGEGGALLINDPQLIERAEIIREKGTNRSRFFRGEVDKYTWVDIGSSYLPSELIAAFLYAQLEASTTITAKRLAIFDRYMTRLEPLQESHNIRMPYIPDHSVHNGHMFYLLLNDEDQRSRLIRHLARQKIHAVFHYVPLHLSPMGRKLGYNPGDFPVTESLAARVLRIPCFFDLKSDDQDFVIEHIAAFFAGEPERDA